MTITGVGSYAQFLNTVRSVTGNQQQINDLQLQLNSKRKSDDLSFYGNDSRRILDLKAEIARRQGYLNAIDTVAPRVKATDLTLTRLNDIISDLSSTTRLPPGPGQAQVSQVTNPGNGNLAVKVNQVNSRFNTAATYTVTATASSSGPPGSFDISVSDGLGGTSTERISLRSIPPAVAEQRFVIRGGPGDGAVLALDVTQLKGTGNSTFTVSYPDTITTRQRILNVTEEVRALLNERVGDRFLFSGERFSTPPVGDLVAARQVSKVTLTGDVGDIGDIYEIEVAGRTFRYVTDGYETSLEDILTQPVPPRPAGQPAAQPGLFDQINQLIQDELGRGETPSLGAIASLNGTVLTLTGVDLQSSFPVETRIVRNGGVAAATAPPNRIGSERDNAIIGAETPANANGSPFTRVENVEEVVADPLATPPVVGVAAVAQIDQIQFVGRDTTVPALPAPPGVQEDPSAVDVGDVFRVSVTGLQRVQVTDDGDTTTADEVFDTVEEGPFDYALAISSRDIAEARGEAPLRAPLTRLGPPAVSLTAGQYYTSDGTATGDPLPALEYVRDRLAAQINADSLSPVTATVATTTTGLPGLDLTSRTPGTAFRTEVEVRNAQNDNRLTVNTLAPLTAQEFGDAVVPPPGLPFYDTDFQRLVDNPRAHVKARLFADDGLPATYGVTSTDPAFQRLAAGLRRARAAVETPGQYERLMAEARNLLIEARDGLRDVQARVVNANITLETAADRHKASINNATTDLARIQGIDENEVAVRLQSLLNTQQATYTVASRVQQLSLINFLA